MRFHRIAQTISLGLFALLLILAAYPYPEGLPTDLFLRLDPSIAAGTSLAARELPLAFLPALAALVACLFVGRIFCGYLCPMGATLDCIEAAMGYPKTRTWRDRGGPARSVSHRTKYVFLLVMMGAALGGVSLVFLGSPLSLTTRLYALVIHPILVLAGEQALALSAPLSRFFSRARLLVSANKDLCDKCVCGVTLPERCGLGNLATSFLVQKSMPGRGFVLDSFP